MSVKVKCVVKRVTCSTVLFDSSVYYLSVALV